MTTHIKVLSKVDRKTFETPPKFSDEERNHYFSTDGWVEAFAGTLRGSKNKIAFVLQLGYFRSSNRFYDHSFFHHDDIDFVGRFLGLPSEEIHVAKLSYPTHWRHRNAILENMGFRKFGDDIRELLEKEALSLAMNQMNPRSVFMSIIDFLRSKKIEVPGYYALSEIITSAFRILEKKLLDLIEENVSIENKEILDDLLTIDGEYFTNEKEDLKIKRYTITLLKKSSQSPRPSKIRENVADLQCLKELYFKLKPAIKSLGVAPELIRYYAQIAIKSQVFQISRRDKQKYLYLIAFVVHQYLKLNDLLTDALFQSVKTALNSAYREHKEDFYQTRHSRQDTIQKLSFRLNDHFAVWDKIENVIFTGNLGDKEKIEAIKSLLVEVDDRKELKVQLDFFDKQSARILKDDDYLDILESKSLKLQNRVSPIIKNLEFDEETSDAALMAAIRYFRDKDGVLGLDAPLEFFEDDQQEVVFTDAGRLRISLYKVLLFEHISSAIKSGSINVADSYKYKAFEDYMIPKEKWRLEKKQLLARAGLSGFENYDNIEPELNNALDDQYRITNENVASGRNKHAKIDAKGDLMVSTPRREKITEDAAKEIFPRNRIISILEVLSTIDKLTNFSACFEHHHYKNIRKRPKNTIFFAGVTGYGCNLGIRRIAKISRNINQNELEYAVNWHFSNENLIHANDKILEFIDRFQLPKLFKRIENATHTSSDGQKFNIHVESLNANYSFKYFGKGKGVTVYSFLDDCHRLFYSVVISASESEAAYVIDGLMHNGIVQSDIHSTDTAGYSEIIFAVCHLLGISFAPRIKNFKDQHLYSFEKRSDFKGTGYRILPDGRINTRIIQENWDDILRFIATIKLRDSPASQLFRRLNSYSRQHPLYRALKEFGKIIKTLFLLKYIDDVDLRQAIQLQLNKQENSNKFGKAVFHGNSREFQQASREEQLIAEGCKRLIENAIICWNYLYLTKQICDYKTDEEKRKLLEAIMNGSVVAWHHINTKGEYDFSDEYLKNSIQFNLDELLDLKIS